MVISLVNKLKIIPLGLGGFGLLFISLSSYCKKNYIIIDKENASHSSMYFKNEQISEYSSYGKH